MNEKLRHAQRRATCDRQRQADRAVLNEMQREEVLSLAQHYPRSGGDPRVSHP